MSALQKAGCYAISRQNNRAAFGLPYLLIELFYIGMPVMRTNGLSGGQSVHGHVINNFFRMGRLLHFPTHGAPLARFVRESSAKKVRTNAIVYNTALNVVIEDFHPLKEVSTKVKLLRLSMRNSYSTLSKAF